MSNSFRVGANVQDTTQEEVLLSCVDRIRAEIPQFDNEQTCFVSDTPWPMIETETDTFCTVSPATASFDDAMEEGAGGYGIVEQSILQVSVFLRISTDRIDRTINELTEASHGLLVLKRAVLRALAGRNLYRRDDPTIPLLHDHLKPRQAMHPPSKSHDDDFTSFSISFLAPFCWDLSE